MLLGTYKIIKIIINVRKYELQPDGLWTKEQKCGA